MLQQWPMLKIEIGVHSDDTPEPGFRVPLTGLRARAILRYLLAKYPKLNQKQIWITGYGDTDPIAPNTSTAGRMQNNRVEIKVLNMNVLNAERARRAAFGSTPAPPAPGLEPRMPETPKE
jgi:flagellar motor protein MotB